MAQNREEKDHRSTQGPTDAERLVTLLVKRGNGSFLRGWRKELDRDGSFDIKLGEEFYKACQVIGFTGDVKLLFIGHPKEEDGKINDETRDKLEHGSETTQKEKKKETIQKKSLKVEELEPIRGGLIVKFREWMHETFGGPVELYSAFDTAGRTRLTFDMFKSACERHRFDVFCHVHGLILGESDFHELFNCCDLNGGGTVSQEEIIFLENDKSLREFALFKAKKTQKERHLKLMCWAYHEDGQKQVSAKHRLAQRPWLAENFEKLPMLVHHKRVERQREANRRGLEARIAFVRHLRDTYGNEVRAWRNGLDPTTKFELTSQDIRAYCRKHDLELDTGDLWKSLDKDCDGFFRLEELSVNAADVLASFQHWAVSSFGSTAAIWEAKEMIEARGNVQGHWASEKKVLHTTFMSVLRALQWPAFDDPGARHLLLSSLDLYGCSFISCADLEWLDKWRMPEWLCAEADPGAWEELFKSIKDKFGHALKAWRMLLDTDNSNNVSWLEFKEACVRIKFKGNIGGAWRALNESLASSISMKEYHAESAELLSSFKDWAETNFGSVKLAFKAIDSNNTGKLSCSELKRACRNYKWRCGDAPGDVQLLFKCLQEDDRLSMKDIIFLDEWQQDPGLEEQAEEEIVNAALSQLQIKHERARVLSTASSLPSLQRPVSSASKTSAVSIRVTTPATPPAALDPGHLVKDEASDTKLANTKDQRHAVRAKQDNRLCRAYKIAAGSKPLQKSRSLPWLKRIIRIDDKMKCTDVP